MTTTAAPADSRTTALAHYAARAVLETVLARHDLDFQQSVTLRPVAVAGTPVERAALVGEVVASLKADPAVVERTVDELAGKGLIEPEGSAVCVTDAGRALFTAVSAETGEVSARIYAGIPEEDLIATGRVLHLVTERADAELAALKA
ncbi:MarR family winged helix-turn-helix transcriptional regulator [Streptomyces sp. NPDC001595]|uniref:MarR family winged helix-turn-helix transcriptional regulator n=1 Tax=Streptomyces sp. NPDC001532 TaxID=3154520 RepID=UPI00333175A3